VTPLLPSPLAEEPQEHEHCYFQFQSPRKRTSSPSDYCVDSLEILAYYCDDNHADVEGLGDSSNGEMTPDDDDDDDDDDLSTASESTPTTPRDQEQRETFCSDESDWLANTTSHDERYRRFKARYCSVVQHPWNSVYTDGDNKVVGPNFRFFSSSED
jgi:hypothetical protein